MAETSSSRLVVRVAMGWREGLGSGRAVARMSEDWEAPRRWASSSRERLDWFVMVDGCGCDVVWEEGARSYPFTVDK